MTLNIIDQSGQPRSDEDLQEAIDALKKGMIDRRMVLPPEIVVLLPTAIECLIELQGFRELVKKIKAKQAQS